MSTLDKMPPDFRKTFERHVKLLRFIGLDIFCEQNISFTKKYMRYCIFNVLFISMAVGQFMYIILGREVGATFVEVANAVPTTLMVVQDAVKMIVVFFKRNAIRAVITEFAKIWPSNMQSDIKKEKYKSWLRRLKSMDDTFFTCSVVALLIYETMPLVATARAMHSDPAHAHYLYPLQLYFLSGLSAHWQYAVGYLYLSTTTICWCGTMSFMKEYERLCHMMGIPTTGNIRFETIVPGITTHLVLYISCDFLLVTLTFDLSTLMDLLQQDLEDAVGNYDRHVEESILAVKSVVARHQKLLWLASEISNIFGLLVFVQISLSSVVICCFGFLTVIAEGMLLNNLVAAIMMAVSIWNLCWPGQLLADASSGVSEAAYRSAWCGRDPELRHCVAIIMTRAQRPCYLTALGFSKLMLANFSKILSSSWSYLSLLNQMYQNSEPQY